MVRHAPVQERSIESMKRMIDAGEQIFYEGGSPALTLEAVIERAGTSTGSFYARFGDMRGFLDAMHERVLAIIGAEITPVFAKSALEPDLESALRTCFIDIFKIFHKHRVPLFFFAVGNSHDREWRAIGAQFTVGMGDVLTQLIKGYLPKSSSAAAKRRIDIAVRISIAAGFQQIMLDQDEVSRIKVNPKVVATDLAEMVSAYLRATPAK